MTRLGRVLDLGAGCVLLVHWYGDLPAMALLAGIIAVALPLGVALTALVLLPVWVLLRWAGYE